MRALWHFYAKMNEMICQYDIRKKKKRLKNPTQIAFYFVNRGKKEIREGVT